MHPKFCLYLSIIIIFLSWECHTFHFLMLWCLLWVSCWPQLSKNTVPSGPSHSGWAPELLRAEGGKVEEVHSTNLTFLTTVLSIIIGGNQAPRHLPQYHPYDEAWWGQLHAVGCFTAGGTGRLVREIWTSLISPAGALNPAKARRGPYFRFMINPSTWN